MGMKKLMHNIVLSDLNMSNTSHNMFYVCIYHKRFGLKNTLCEVFFSSSAWIFMWIWHNVKCCSLRQMIKIMLLVSNLLAPGRCGCNLKLIIFELISRVDILSISYGFALRHMSQDICHGLAWCCQAWGHCLNQCQPCFVIPYFFTINQHAFVIEASRIC